MSAEKKAPTFVKPGDDPSLDQLVTTIKHDGDEKDPAYFYDMFGRRQKKADGEGAEGAAVVPPGKAPSSKTRWRLIAGFALVAMAAPVLVVVLGRGPKSTPAEQGTAASVLPALSMMAPAMPTAPSATAPSPSATVAPATPSATPSASAMVAPVAPSGTHGRATTTIKDDDPYADPQNRPNAGRKPRPIIH
jgi:hypothetical protein